MVARLHDIIVRRARHRGVFCATVGVVLLVAAILNCHELVLADTRHTTSAEQGGTKSRDQQVPGAVHLARTDSATGLPALRDSRVSGPYCGIYSLYVCLSALGIETRPASFVSPKYVGSFRGSSARELIDAAEDFGAHAECFSNLTHRELRLVQTPMILHMRGNQTDADFNHWVAFLGCEGDRMRIIDAPGPLQTISPAELLANWDGAAIAFSKDSVDKTFLLEGRIQYILGIEWLLLALYGLRRLFGGDSPLPLGVPLRVRAKRVPLQAGVIFGFSLLVGLAYHALSDVGFLRNTTALAEVARRHYSLDLPEISLGDVEREICESQPLVLDARHVADYQRGAVPGARSMSVDSTLAERQEVLANVPKEKRIIVYCQSALCGYADNVARFLKFT